MNREEREQPPMRVNPWVTPALLAVVGLGGMGSYGQLSALNDQMAEQNRLAEMRGSTEARLAAMDREIQALRVEAKGFALASDTLEDRRTMIAAMQKLRVEVNKKVDANTFEQQNVATQSLLTTISTYQERLVTHEQLQVLIGRVDAISRRLPGHGQAEVSQ